MNGYDVYTDGGCLRNPGGVGATAAVVLKDDEIIHTISKSYKVTTSNRMEIMAVIQAMEYLLEIKCDNITIFSDSQYVVNTINRDWLKNWIIRKTTHEKKNMDLWFVFWDLYKSFNQIKLKWIPGHRGNKYNELADELATNGLYKKDLLDDVGYLETKPVIVHPYKMIIDTNISEWYSKKYKKKLFELNDKDMFCCHVIFEFLKENDLYDQFMNKELENNLQEYFSKF